MYSGSTCKQGEIEAVVIATGVHTFFGKAAHLVDSTNQVGHFQKASSKTIYLQIFLVNLAFDNFDTVTIILALMLTDCICRS